MATPLTARGYTAIRHLIHTTDLGTLPTVRAAVDEDRRTIDLEHLEGWPYSSGEQVMVDALRAFATSHGGPSLSDLTRLDTQCQAAVLSAVRLWLGLDLDPFGE